MAKYESALITSDFSSVLQSLLNNLRVTIEQEIENKNRKIFYQQYYN